MTVAEDIVPGAIILDKETGAVIYTDKTKQISAKDFEEIRAACPYDIPRRDPKTGLISKCTMCYERITKGMLPVCVKVCPTGAMNFGERKEMLDLAKQRLTELKKTFPKAHLANSEDVNVIYLLIDEPQNYHKFASTRPNTDIDRKMFLAKLGAPFRKSVQNFINL